MNVVTVVLALIGLWVAPSLWTLYRNYRAACKSGFPVVVCPVNVENLFHQILGVPLRPLLRRILPAAVYGRVQVSIFGWEFIDKYAAHRRFGPAFILVTLSKNELWCADPAVMQIILARRKDFGTLPMASTFIGWLGENLLTSDGETWARQRRLVAPNLNERISEGVWEETHEQTSQMADYMASRPGGASRDTVSGLRAVAINVLGQVAYGQAKPFAPIVLPRDPDADMSYIEAISLATELLVVAALVKTALLTLPFMPKTLQTLGASVGRLPGLTRGMLERERARMAAGTDAHDNIMSMLVRMSDKAKDDAGHNKAAGAGGYLTEAEISGNMFIFTAAGYDTTANTLAYAVVSLAAYPEWQAWVQDQLDEVLGEYAEGERPEYCVVYPKLTRCLALMYETVRLFPPVVHISRGTNADQVIKTSGQTYYLPGPCIVYINNPALHTSPDHWGEDSLVFRPSRWLDAAGQLVPPERGHFGAWSGGPRVCPGQKMSQVEFTAVVATLFGKCSVEPVCAEGQDPDQARQALVDLMQDSQPRITLQMNRPQDVHLRYLRRSRS